MSRLACRGSIVRAAVLVALLSSRPADAQQVGPPYQPTEPGGLVNDLLTGVWYDKANQAKAEKGLQHVQEKLRRDTERCDWLAVDRDARLIQIYLFRITVDEWLIRQNSLLDPGWYPYPVRRDPMTCAAIAQASRPPDFLSPPQYYPRQGPIDFPPTFTITIVNTGPVGPGVAFAIDGIPYVSAGGSSPRNLLVPSDSIITYDGGGSIGRRRYQVSPGIYEFRSTAEGWTLYKLPPLPENRRLDLPSTSPDMYTPRPLPGDGMGGPPR